MVHLHRVLFNLRESEEMNIGLLIYLAGVSESIGCVCAILLLVTAFVAAFNLFLVLECDATVQRWPYWVFLIAAVVGCLVPGKQTIYTLIAAEGLQTLTATPRAAELADNSLKVIEKAMGEYLKDTKEK